MLRTMDLAWCPMLPIGTHFLWHLLAGLLLWVVSVELTLRRFGSDLRKPAYGDPKDWSRGFDRRLQACRDRLRRYADAGLTNRKRCCEPRRIDSPLAAS
jgi:hypothetical protein